MIKVDRIKVGDILWDYHSYRMGNTTMRRWGNWDVRIISIADDGYGTKAVVSWNGNPPETYNRYQLRRLRRTEGPVK